MEGLLMSPLHLLDCTLRDGGYYNNWNFSRSLVAQYLKSIHQAGIRAVEIGFRNLPHDGFAGPYAYSTDQFLADLKIPHDVMIAVMINAKAYLSASCGPEKAIASAFQKSANSVVKMVRVAVYPEQLSETTILLEKLKSLGYQTCINLMQVTCVQPFHLQNLASTVQEEGVTDVFYFADSLGNMRPDQVKNIFGLIRSGWKGAIGIHTHDNMGQALINSIAAVEAGAEWIDSTILGMGRGAGNASTELLTLELNNRGCDQFYPDFLFPIVLEDFERLKTEFKWGTNLLYYLSGMYGIHPTYMQEILGKGIYAPEQILNGLEFLKRSRAVSYRDSNLSQAMSNLHTPFKGSWNASGWAQGREILVLGSGPSLQNYREDVVHFIKRRNPIVISLNVNKYIPEECITAYAACHKTRLLIDADKYHILRKPIIMPIHSIPDAVRGKFEGLEILDYGMATQDKVFVAEPRDCIIPKMLVAAYALALGVASGSSRIYLVGFDGYELQDPRYSEMEEIFALYKKNTLAPPIISLIPTTYTIQQDSLYSPIYYK